MTYCLGVKVRQGLIAIADTRITTGSETTNAKKISLHKQGGNNIFLMTSGLRSVRDKAVTYFEETLEEKAVHFDKMHKVVNAFGEQLRRVAAEDKEAITASGLTFNLHTIVGGKLENDKEHKLFLLYPEGNWIEIGEATPFAIIGNSGYGNPILKRALNFDSPLTTAIKTGFLSFDSTRVSANDVGYPIDVVIYHKDTGFMHEARYEEEDTRSVAEEWGERLKAAIEDIDDQWIDKLVANVEQEGKSDKLRRQQEIQAQQQ